MKKKEEISEEDVDTMLDELERKLSRVRVLYEQYFTGIQKRPPQQALRDVVRRIRKLESISLKKTSAKFRFRALSQKFYTYRTYWNRTCREIENGTYKRHVQRVEERKKRRKEREEKEQAVQELQEEVEAFEIDLDEFDDLDGLDEIDLDDLNSPDAGPSQPSSGQRTSSPPSGGGQTPNQVRGASADQIREKTEKLRNLRTKLGLGDSRSQKKQQSSDASPPSPPSSGSSSGPRYKPPSDSSPSSRSKRPARGSGPTRSGPTRSGSTRSGGGQNKTRAALKAAGLSEGKLRNIYKTLVDAKRKCNESTANLTYDNVVRSIAKQADTVKRKHNSSQVDFQVVIKKGRAYLKPVPK